MTNFRIFSVIIAAALVCLFSAGPAPAADNGLRSLLASSDEVKLLYSIDDRHTFVRGVDPAGFEGSAGELTEVHRFGSGDEAFYIVEHTRAQPLAYKTPALPGVEDLAPFSRGNVELGREGGPTGADLFQRASARCGATGGELTYVIPRRTGSFKRLVEVSPLDAFSFIVGTGGDGAWYIACGGPENFVVTKGYRAVSGGVETARVWPGRNMRGVNYVKAAEFSSVPVPEPTEPIGEFLERMAREVAAMKSTFVKARGVERYRGVYDEAAEGCDKVRIERIDTPELVLVRSGSERKKTELAGADAVDFKVCRGKVKTPATASAGSVERLARR